MRKRSIVILLLVCLLAGCTSKHSYINTEQTSSSYVEGQDHQQYWNYFGATSAAFFTKGENGYYYYNMNHRLIYYYDLENKLSVPLCNQPECEHNSSKCNAYFDYGETVDYLHFYYGHLYTIGYRAADSNDICVFRISPDGSTRENIGTLGTLEGMGNISFAVHRGYVYYSVSAKNGVAIYRFCLDGKQDSKLIYTIEGQIGGSMRLSASGNYLYMHYTHLTNDTADGYSGELYRYEVHDDTVELVLENIWRDFVVERDVIYYDNGSQIMTCDLVSQTKTVLVDTKMPVYLTTADNTLIFDNGCGIWISGGNYAERTISAYNFETRNAVTDIPLESEYGELVGADGEHIVFMIPQKKAGTDAFENKFFVYRIDEAKAHLENEVFGNNP